MALDLSRRFSEIIAGTRRVPAWTTLAIALIVTAMVAIPLTERALRSNEETPAADPDLILVDLIDKDPMQLDGSTVGGLAFISINHPTATGVSFNLFQAGGSDPLLASQDLTGPNFFPVQRDDGWGDPIDTSTLADGEYELFATVTTEVGDQRTAVRFTVANP